MPSLIPSLRTAIVCATLVATGAGAGVAVSAHAAPAAPLAGIAPFVPGHVLVHYAADASAADQTALEHANGASRIGRVADVGVEVLRVPIGTELHAIGAMEHSGKVRYAELDGLAHATDVNPNDPYWPQEWGQAKTGVPSVWDSTQGDPSIVVAQLDSGVDYSHPDLQGRFVAGYDFVNNDTTPADDYGHGTKAAGVLGAASNNGTGIASYCWQCSIMPIKVLDASGAGSYSSLISAITWATDHGARVISMSLVGSASSSALQSAVQYAYSHGVVVVGAAGNAGNSTPTYPASYPEVLSVAGSTSSDTLYSWSSYGSWVDVAAPGCTTSTVLGGSYGSFCGTSSATPAAAGVVGLLLSAKPAATNVDIMNALESTAVPIGSQVADGRIDASAALAAVLNSSSAPAPTPTTSPSPAPSPTPSPSPSVSTVSYSGSITTKTQSRSFPVSVGAGQIDATATFTKGGPLSVQIVDSSGAVVTGDSGGSPVQASAVVNGGAFTIVVAGTVRTSFTLTVTATSP